ncbi:MAG: hypothetical protein KDD70_18860 [Bdellovibrionales bacterium]|nr:hypothetical protein [Bdellovibrionales bacterium]
MSQVIEASKVVIDKKGKGAVETLDGERISLPEDGSSLRVDIPLEGDKLGRGKLEAQVSISQGRVTVSDAPQPGDSELFAAPQAEVEKALERMRDRMISTFGIDGTDRYGKTPLSPESTSEVDGTATFNLSKVVTARQAAWSER